MLVKFILILLYWCKENDIQVVDGTKIKDTNIDISKVDEFIKALKIPNIEVRDYQKEPLFTL